MNVVSYPFVAVVYNQPVSKQDTSLVIEFVIYDELDYQSLLNSNQVHTITYRKITWKDLKEKPLSVRIKHTMPKWIGFFFGALGGAIASHVKDIVDWVQSII